MECSVRYDEHILQCGGQDFHVGKHARLQTAIFICDRNADFQRARFRFDAVADEHGFPEKRFAGIRKHREPRFLPDAHRPDVTLLDFRQHPQIRRVTDRVDRRVLADEFSGRALALDDDAVNRGFQFEGFAEQFRGLHESEHIACFHAVVQVGVEFGEPAFEHARDLGGLVQIFPNSSDGLERQVEAAASDRFGFDRDMREIFLRQRDDIVFVLRGSFGGRFFGDGFFFTAASQGDEQGEGSGAAKKE